MNALHEIVILLAAAIVVVPVFRRLGLSAVPGYLVAGILVGPSGLGLITDVGQILHLSELGIVLMLFVTGLALDPERVRLLRRSVFGLGAAQVAATGLLLGLAGFALGLDLRIAVVIGLALALSSTACTLQLLGERAELHERHGRSALAVVLFQDLAVIPLLALIPLMGEAGVAGTPSATWRSLATAVIAIAAVVIGGRLVLRPLLRVVAASRTQEIVTATALLVAVGVPLLLAEAGLSMALGAFLAGLLLADSDFRHEFESAVEPFRSLLVGLFFVATGMSVNMGLLVSSPLAVLGMVAAFMAIKAAVLGLIARTSGHDRVSALGFVALLASGGEFAFVIFGMASAHALIPPATAEFLVLAVTISMGLTPVLVALAARVRGADDPADRKLRVFVSYSRQDFRRADELVGVLEADGFEVTLDTRDLPFGERWQDELDHFIRRSDIVVWLVSRASIASRWCRWELERVTEHGKRLFPIFVENVPPEDLPETLGDVQVFPQSGTVDLADAGQRGRLRDALRANGPWLREHTRLSERARLWAEGGRGADWLLRGRELAAAEAWRERAAAQSQPVGPLVLDLIHASRVAEGKT
ncbi:MAG: TIR domain-containing protein [Betaproteobacteria bacterium]|nr:TIR domain-containing protein [Betaproteobacteria bacterium]